jgi:hypothetical protein
MKQPKSIGWKSSALNFAASLLGAGLVAATATTSAAESEKRPLDMPVQPSGQQAASQLQFADQFNELAEDYALHVLGSIAFAQVSLRRSFIQSKICRLP